MGFSSKGFGKVQSVEVGGNPRTIYSSNPGVHATIEALLALGCPPIPVAPKQDPRAEGCHHQHFVIVRFKEVSPNQPAIQGDYCRISQTKVGDFVAPVKGDYCRLDEKLQPIGRFTGKNPSYLDRNGRARSLNHKTYQNRLPYEWELREWFSNPETGIGTLGGHSGVVWIDFDAKNYSSQDDCDRDVQRIISANNLEDAWIERTGSGGWRIAVCPQNQPAFTNFSTTIDGEHIGEALWEGRFTVLAPTIHPNGNPYRRIGWSSPAEVESLEAIGIFPTKDEIANQTRKQKRSGQSASQSTPTNPIDNPWDIRNFADRLIGYRIEGDWIECKCPAHNGTSDDSLHIRIDTGAYKCWAGCDTKRIQQEALAISVAGGYELPETESQPKSEQSDRDRLISKRVLRFRQFWNDLQRDFLLPTLVKGNEIRFQAYQGFAPMIDLFWETTCLQGWLGAGKTTAMLRSLIPYQDKAIVWLAPRNGLLRQTAEKAKELGFSTYHYQDNAGEHARMLRIDQPGIYFMAPDSLKTYAVTNIEWQSKILVIDEFSGIRKEILGKTAELPQFTDAISRCASLLVADAFLSRVDIRVVRKYRSGSMQILNQEFKKSPVKIKWLECRNRKGDISFSHEGLYYPLIDQWIEEKLGRIAIAVDSIHIAKMLDRYLKSKGVKTWIVCSETPEQNKGFMPDPDKLIESGKIQAVIYTPTAQSGLDIQAKFDRGLLICTGTLAPTQMLQMLGRCRQCPEWYVSAPRHSGSPECVTPSLDGNKIRGWTEQIRQTFADLGFNAPLEAQGWGIWEELTRGIEKAFTSEYMRHLLDHFFEAVEAVEVENDRVTEWRKDSQILKNEECEKILKANLSNGLRLIDEQKQPTLNSEVWDIKLAEFGGKYPKVAKKAIFDFEQSEIQVRQSNAEIDRLGGCDAIRVKLSELAANIEQLTDAIEILDERLDILKRFYAESDSPDDWQALVDARREWFLLTQRRTNTFAEYAKLDRLLLSAKGELALDAIDMTKLFHSRRVEKLKNYVMATEPNEQDDRDLLQYLRERPTHYNAGNFKRLQNIKLFRSLNLGSLASIANIKEVEADVNSFRALSPAIVKLYRQFQANSELIRLFPLIDSEKAFFDHLKACMSYLGYERGGKSIRVETEGLNQNGFDRKGNQRFSKSKTFYFVFWFLMECSGSAYFRENLELILEALRDRLATERDDRQRRREQKERYETPPPGWEAQAA
ncbi:MAG: bifunctional DNA primase/polymerase [Leptolyngbya sp. UWPOB_LEPTO1]|uniref:bifunctional DNA primase/polymerase n=1 Tax=Leptolyngbya sp. UWPOB_LEPTO1 TaxID=2815653 RepID=UPI001AC75B14|nr:bifunctional DNA primase/polymerase [Leptolyngbya sp. UWPOB_LEPTO1]MBN8563453.1 bifunctional DNA primase/polymerase [Leptolyngbya sp. UWPOB_LEPTO1]